MFPSTFKVEENKVPLFFHFESKRPRYGHFVIFSSFILKQMMIKTSKWWYLGDLSPKWKNTGTLFPTTFKIEENKVPLFFHLEPKWLRYCYFVVFLKIILNQKMIKQAKTITRPYFVSFNPQSFFYSQSVICSAFQIL